MQKKLIVDYSLIYKRIAILENEELTEIVIEENNALKVGDIYIGVVKKIIPNKFAFIDIGRDKNVFLCLNDKQEENLFSIKNNKRKLNLKEEQNIIVQVKKDGNNLKSEVVTSNISLTGRYIILLLHSKNISISRKINDFNLKNKLIDFVKSILPEEYGIIIRTNSKNLLIENLKEEIKEELKFLIQKAKDLEKYSFYKSLPNKIYAELSEEELIIRDYFSNEDKVYVNDKNEYVKIKEKTKFPNIFFYNEDLPIFEKFYVESQLEKALNNKVWLKSGGFIIIEQVEAMTFIDVNSGKNIMKSYEEMALKTNIEASYEIYKQIKLRNISGMIIIDFINMKDEKDLKKLTNIFFELIKNDRIPTFVLSITELGLLQITRKKMRKSLNETLMCNCPVCLGNGYVQNENYIANKIKNQVLSILSTNRFDYIKVSSNKKIINCFKKIFDTEYYEFNFDKKVETEIIQTSRFDYFKIEKK